MDFTTYLYQSWQEHGDHPVKVSDSFFSAFDLIIEANQAAQLSQLMTHVFGEHLGEWQRGVKALSKLKTLPQVLSYEDTLSQIERNIATLNICAINTNQSGSNQPDIQIINQIEPILKNFSTSDKIRIFATAASALSAQKNISLAQTYYNQAFELSYQVDQTDPAIKSLAITSNNLAYSLEQFTKRSPEQTDLMIFAAKGARQFWEQAGTWLEVERAEYRLAHSYIKAGLFIESMNHAHKCLDLCKKHNAPDLEYFFAYECLALAEKAAQNTLGYQQYLQLMESSFAKLPDEDKKWCRASLEQLKAHEGYLS